MTTVVDRGEALLQFLYRAPVGLVETTLDGDVEMINPKSAQLLMPITRSGGLENLFDVLAPVLPQLRTLVAGFDDDLGVICEGLRFDVSAFHPDARTHAISLMKIDPARLMAVIVDVTPDVRREASAIADRLHEAARVDTLTRMPNRVAMAEAMEAAWTTDDPPHGSVAILLVGCERLFGIAESFGDDVRNGVLDAMARRLRAVLRPRDGVVNGSEVDPIAARVSADEFVVLLRRLSQPADALLVARRMLATLSAPYVVGTHQLHCGVSIGIVHGEGGSAPDQALRDAGLAMREAKRLGGSRVVEFDVGLRERAERRGTLEMDLRRALEASQLFVVYQPIVALQDARRRTVGVEALVRWRHPERGVVSPVDFIPIAEETGLIHALGRFVLQTACRRFAAWSAAFGDDAPRLLAVNLSRAQLSDAGFVYAVQDVLRSTGLPAGRLQLEVTESLAAQDDDVRTRLQELKDLGITLALDDFGTGYSSLSSLHLLPVDTVKIDRSFVMRAEESLHHRVLIEATIRVAKSLGMATVAEGLETDGQVAIVRELGCDKGQGYRLARPLSADDLAARIAHERDSL